MTVTVTGTRLVDERGTARAVVVVHDVTAERRHREELASFRRGVAHDLQNPLTAVPGWTDTAAETLQDLPAHPMVADAERSLARARRAATRMRTLIDDVLSYATARDAVSAPAVVDLGTVVTDIAAARADAAVAAGVPAPRFDIGALHPVNADPRLLRQLIDNLLGNAIKYAAAGVTPEIAITSTEHGDGQIEVTITDNGCRRPGRPTRSHRRQLPPRPPRWTRCRNRPRPDHLQTHRRRHGGTINAADNPTGGARFTFTLPAAAMTPHVPALASR